MDRIQTSLATYAGQRLAAEQSISGAFQVMLQNGLVFGFLIVLMLVIDVLFNTLVIGTAFIFSCIVLLFASRSYRRALAEEFRFVRPETLSQYNKAPHPIHELVSSRFSVR